MMPVLIVEPLIYFVSIKNAYEVYKKVLFRQMNNVITTRQENDDLWSTDGDELDIDEPDLKKKPVNIVVSGVSEIEDKKDELRSALIEPSQADVNRKNSSSSGKRKSVSWLSLTQAASSKSSKKIEKPADRKEGPFDVTWSKPYKPVFVLMADLWLFIAIFALVSTVYMFTIDQSRQTNFSCKFEFNDDDD